MSVFCNESEHHEVPGHEQVRPLTQEQIAGAVRFHGHHCPGLTIGLRAAQWCLGVFGSSSDEELVTVTETDSCGVDAIQYLTGCTFGKGNLVFRDLGKVAFTFYRRRDGKGKRLILNPDFAGELRSELAGVPNDGTAESEALRKELRQALIDRMLNAPLEELFQFSDPTEPVPERARLHRTVRCDRCGEGVMEPRTVVVDGHRLCRSCAAK